MKTWQHGYELEELKRLETFYAPHNQYALSVFAKFKKNDIAAHLHEHTLRLMEESGEGTKAAMVVEVSKVPSKIKMFGNVIIGEKQKGDVTVSRLVGDPHILLDQLDRLGDRNVWFVTFAGNTDIRNVAERAGFDYVGSKISSFSEIYAVYFRNAPMNVSPRKHPVVNPAELVGITKLGNSDVTLMRYISKKITELNFDYNVHYSNYNRGKAWSAISLRGYSPDPLFITKPEEMNSAWHTKHQGERFTMQDTSLFNHFPEIRRLLGTFNTEIHRVRFMRLMPGGGEIERHTDTVDPDSGLTIGKLARIHFPIKTNTEAIFTIWNKRDEQEDHHYSVGDYFILDTRYPHRVINGGTEERIHLVADLVVTAELQQTIISAKSFYRSILDGGNISQSIGLPSRGETGS